MLKTEMRNPLTTNIDKVGTLEMLKIIQEENKNAVNALDDELENIAKAVDAVSYAVSNGGSVYYVGAGTSGRLGVLDAAECPPTFGVSSDMFVGIMAGGEKALINASENKEDCFEAGENALKNKNLTSKDVVVGISAAGGALFVLGAISYAKTLGCVTVGITSNKGTAIDLAVDIPISPDTGAEVVTGSTRMKAGTAQKLILNMLSTCAMIKNGYVYENLMINLKPTNIKLKNRVINIVSEVTNLSKEEAVVLLEKSDWNIKKAISLVK